MGAGPLGYNNEQANHEMGLATTATQNDDQSMRDEIQGANRKN